MLVLVVLVLVLVLVVVVVAVVVVVVHLPRKNNFDFQDFSGGSAPPKKTLIFVLQLSDQFWRPRALPLTPGPVPNYGARRELSGEKKIAPNGANQPMKVPI